jgi:O-antigen/teichoic acid export membrane protein
VSRTRRYIANVIWNSASTGVGLVIAILMTPITLGYLGETRYGEWTIALSLVEYYWLIDLGFRSATVKYSADFNARGDRDKLSELLSTGVLYSSMMAVLVILISLVFANPVAAAEHLDHPALLRIVGVSWGIGMVFNIFSGCLEGFQRFDLLSRIWMVTSLIRSAGILAVLKLGYGVMAMGCVLFGAQMSLYLWTWLAFRHVVPGLIVSPLAGTAKMLKHMARYGLNMLTAQVATRILSMSVPLTIGYLLGPRYVTYWSIPVKMMEYAFDAIGRIGMVTTPASADFAARGEHERLHELGVYTNRYCLALFAPYAAFLLVYGQQVYILWSHKPIVVAEGGFLIPILLLGYCAVAGQFNSASILHGLGRHQTYVRFMLVESLLAVGGLFLVVPRFGLAGAGWVLATLMALDRGVLVGVLFCREIEVNPFTYMVQIYTRPVALGAAMALALWLLRTSWLPGDSWLQVGSALLIAGSLYTALAAALVLTPQHREQLLRRFAPWLGPRAEANIS